MLQRFIGSFLMFIAFGHLLGMSLITTNDKDLHPLVRHNLEHICAERNQVPLSVLCTHNIMYMTLILVSIHRLFTATVYLAFLGLVVLLLVSVLVAQATDTYNSVHGIADQMANYSSARLLTQTSSILPMWLCCFFMVNIYSDQFTYVLVSCFLFYNDCIVYYSILHCISLSSISLPATEEVPTPRRSLCVVTLAMQ